MQEVLDYRMVQFCPSVTDDVRINIGVEVSDGSSRYLAMLKKTDLRRRCKSLSGREPSTENGVISQLIEEARWSARRAKGVQILPGFRENMQMPELLETSGRYNNLVRLSEPNRVVYGNPVETANFLLEHLAPVEEPQRRPQVRTRITNRFLEQARARPALAGAVFKKPAVTVRSQTVGVDFGVHSDEVKMLGRALNFDREIDDAFTNELYSLNHLFTRIRSTGGSTSDPETDSSEFEVPREVALSVLYRPPSGPQSRSFFDGLADEWNELDVEFVPENRMGKVIDQAELLLLI